MTELSWQFFCQYAQRNYIDDLGKQLEMRFFLITFDLAKNVSNWDYIDKKNGGNCELFLLYVLYIYQRTSFIEYYDNERSYKLIVIVILRLVIIWYVDLYTNILFFIAYVLISWCQQFFLIHSQLLLYVNSWIISYHSMMPAVN